MRDFVFSPPGAPGLPVCCIGDLDSDTDSSSALDVKDVDE